ncbi:MAG: hypothetical protein IPH45_16530 [Bacteroidales bacterium]|nr:hypothetical protein [Bacteroidales bacterium]MBK7173342.1 hypothetical protein [Bacteroidales bacterium]
MGSRIYFLAALLIIMFAACKKDGDNNNTNEETVDKLTTIWNVGEGAMQVFSDTLEATHDTVAAINAAGHWLVDQPEVADAYYWSKQLIEIRFKNGLRSSVSFTWEDDNGQHLSRGGSTGSSKLFNYHGVTSKEAIKNEKVLVLNPYTDEFNTNGYNKRNQFNGGPKVLEVSIFNDEAVTYDLLSTFGDYGFIILNTHGLPWGFFINSMIAVAGDVDFRDWTREDVLSVLTTWFGPNIPLEKFENGELETGVNAIFHDFTHTKTYIQLLVTDKYIRNSTLDLNGTVVFNNSCYSGNTKQGPTIDNQPEAFKSKGCISYYGYAFSDNSSGSAPNDFANKMEDSLIANLVRRGDTTAVAHLIDDVTLQYSIESKTKDHDDIPIHVTREGLVFKPTPPNVYHKLYFQHFFEPNYCYEKCGDTLVDSRDQQKYATVCIGDQVWMAENLNYADGGACYDNNSANCNTYGRIYTINEVTGLNTSETNPSGIQGICPEGWHVPSKAEWEQLIAYVGGTAAASTQLRSTTGWPTPNENSNLSGFNMLPSGHFAADNMNSLFRFLGQDAKFWTTSASDGYYYAVNAYHPDLNISTYSSPPSITFKFSCRCVKD